MSSKPAGQLEPIYFAAWPCVVAKDRHGRTHTYYQHQIMPDNIDPAERDRLLTEQAIAPVSQVNL